MSDFELMLTADSRGLVSGDRALDQIASTAEKTERQVTRASGAMAKGLEQVGQKSIYASQQLRMQAMQLSQVAQQASATGNVMQAIAIQLPDLALGFGPIGIAAGAAAGAVLSYFSTFDGADDANDVLDDQISLIQKVADNWGDAIPAIRQYADELARARGLADLQAGGQITVEAQYDKLRGDLEGFNDEYGRTIELLNSTDGTDKGVMSLTVAYQDLEEKIKAGTATVEDYDRVQREAANVAATTGYEDITSFASAFDILTGKAMTSLSAIKELQVALNGQAGMLDPRTWRSAGLSGQTADGEIQNEGFKLPAIGPVPGSRGTPELSGFPWEEFNRQRRGSSRTPAISQAEREQKAVGDLIKELHEELSLVNAGDEAKRAAAASRQAGSAATSDERKEIISLTEAIYQEEQARNRAIDQMDEYKEATSSILDDVRSALDDGKISWSEWADIASNALDKVVNKLQDDLLDSLFSANKGSTGGGGWFSSLFGMFGGGGFASLPAVGPVPASRPSFDGGGYTGSGARAGGLDGKGGFMAMLHPQETVVDHSKGGSGVHVTSDVRVSVDQNGNLQAYVERTSTEIADQRSAANIRQYDGEKQNLYANGHE